jgi:hypothetical protein
VQTFDIKKSGLQQATQECYNCKCRGTDTHRTPAKYEAKQLAKDPGWVKFAWKPDRKLVDYKLHPVGHNKQKELERVAGEQQLQANHEQGICCKDEEMR